MEPGGGHFDGFSDVRVSALHGYGAGVMGGDGAYYPVWTVSSFISFLLIV
jgi:hypothetical protein